MPGGSVNFLRGLLKVKIGVLVRRGRYRHRYRPVSVSKDAVSSMRGAKFASKPSVQNVYAVYKLEAFCSVWFN